MSRTGKIALATGFPGALMSGCARATFRKKSWEEVLGGDNYSRLTQLWDPVYGPPVQEFSRYGGVGDFRGHIRGGATPGIDYDVPKGFPLVPSTTSYLRQIQRDNNGALYVLLMDVYSPSYFTYLGHLQEVFVDEKFLLVGEIGKYLREGIRALGRQEVVALSGNSGLGPKEYGWVQPPHLHYSLYSWNATKRALENLDPDQYGVDGGKPVLWDGKTALDIRPEDRIVCLERTLVNFDRELNLWQDAPDLDELRGRLLEYRSLLGHAGDRAILDSKHFQDMRALLKRAVLDEKRYPPGSGPYGTMLKILGYSTDEKQRVILTLPFIAPGLEKIYKRPVYDEGIFFTLIPYPK
jgi:hypothetical protein